MLTIYCVCTDLCCNRVRDLRRIVIVIIITIAHLLLTCV